MSALTRFISQHSVEWFVDGSEIVILDQLRSLDGSYLTELCRVSDLAGARQALGY